MAATGDVGDVGAGRRWVAGDLALALGLVVLSFAFAGSSDPPGVTIQPPTRSFDLLAAVLVLAQAVPLAFRQVAPSTVLGVSVGASVLAVGLGMPPSPANMAILVAPYSAAKFVRSGRLWQPVAVLAVVYALLGWASAEAEPGRLNLLESSLVPLLLVVPFGVGLVQRGRWLRLQRLEADAREMQREAARRHRAVAEERRRVARELHDIVGHAVTGMIVQAEAARVQSGTPEPVDAALADIATTGRQALGELRMVLDLMRRADWRPDTSATGGEMEVPGTAQLPVLADQVRRTGHEVGLETAGEVRALPAPVDASVFRIVQEALTNVVKHAGRAPARVRLTYREDEIEVLVEDDGGPDAPVTERPGYGLVGMRERVQLFGGRLETGRLPRGFRVRAVLPAPPVTARSSDPRPQRTAPVQDPPGEPTPVDAVAARTADGTA